MGLEVDKHEFLWSSGHFMYFLVKHFSKLTLPSSAIPEEWEAGKKEVLYAHLDISCTFPQINVRKIATNSLTHRGGGCYTSVLYISKQLL